MTDNNRQVDPTQLIEIINEFLQLPLDEKRDLLEREAETLLHPDAEAELRNAALSEQSQLSDEEKQYVVFHAELLANCRSQGINAVFAAIATQETSIPVPELVVGMLRQLQSLMNDPKADSPQSLRDRIELCRQILVHLPRQDHLDVWTGIHATLAVGLSKLAERTLDLRDLTASEEACDSVLNEITRTADPQEWARIQHYLGATLKSLGQMTKDPSVLRRAELALRAALEERSRTHAPQEWSLTKGTLAAVLHHLGDFTQNATLLRQAVEACSETMEVRTRSSAPMDWAILQSNIGAVTLRLYDLTRDSSYLDQSIEACRSAMLEHTRDRAPMDWAHSQINLGNSLARIGELKQDATMLREAEEGYLSALEEWADGDAIQRARIQTDLGLVLQSLASLTGECETLKRAEEAYRLALKDQEPASVPLDWLSTHAKLAQLLLETGKLTEYIAVQRQAEDTCSSILQKFVETRGSIWIRTQQYLGEVLLGLGELTADAMVLHRAEDAFRAALEEISPTESPIQWARIQNDLGLVFQHLGRMIGDPVTLRRAAAAYSLALTKIPRDELPWVWSAAQNNLGAVLQMMGDLAQDVALLQLAEKAFHNALEIRTRERAPEEWASTQNNLASVLGTIGKITRNTGVLRLAEYAHLGALEERPRARFALDWARTLNNLGTVLTRLGEQTNDVALLRRAEEAYRSALEERTRERIPRDWAITKCNLGHALQVRGNLTGDSNLLCEAEIVFRESLDAMRAIGAEDMQQGVASELAEMLSDMKRYVDAADVIEPTLGVSDLAIMDASRSSEGRARAIERVGDLYGLLSLCRLRQEPPDLFAALNAAAAGRARLLAYALALDTVRLDDINDSEVRAKVEAAQNQRIALRLKLEQDSYPPNEPANSARRPKEDIEHLQSELRQATEAYVELCRTHGLVRSLEPLSREEMVAAAPRGGAVVLPVLTDSTAFAFVLIDGNPQPTVIDSLPINTRAVREHLSGDDRWLDIYYNHFDSHQQYRDGTTAQRATEAAWHDQLAATLLWLWERILCQIHAHLQNEGLEAKAPVVLLVPGMLGRLPLHAAGPGPDGLHFCDCWTVSYAPSIRALLSCQERAHNRRTLPTRLLAVIDPPTSGSQLWGAQQEAAMLRERFAHGECQILWREQATLEAVIAYLPTATYFHASTHGMHDPIRPMRSLLMLADNPLRLEMLQEIKLQSARLVFLSACESGLSGVRNLPEEFIGLATGFVQAGAACVLASLWPIDDAAAFLLSSKFYEVHLNQQGLERCAPDRSLAQAQDWLRRLNFEELKRMFPMDSDSDGPLLLLTFSSIARVNSPLIDERTHVIRLRLGRDEDQPFAHPTHWASFVAMGA